MHLRTRLTIGLATAAAATGAALVPATMASAAVVPNAQLSIDSGNAPVSNGQTIFLSGSGYNAGAPVYLAECADITAGDPNSCDGLSVNTDKIAIVNADANGAFTHQAFTVHTGTTGNGTCDSTSTTCGIAATDNPFDPTNSHVGGVPITFTAAPATAVTPTVSAASTKAKVATGKAFAVKGKVVAAAKGVNGMTVKLYQRANAKKAWKKVASKTTATKKGVAGTYKFGLKGLSHSEQYQVRSIATTLSGTVYKAAKSKTVTVK